MSVVPCVVVNEDGPVAHAGNLVAVVPPGEDLRVLLGVHLKPVVGLAEVVDDNTRAIVTSAGQNDRRGRIGLGSHVSRVVDVARKEPDQEEDDTDRSICGDVSLLLDGNTLAVNLGTSSLGCLSARGLFLIIFRCSLCGSSLFSFLSSGISFSLAKRSTNGLGALSDDL